MFGKLFRSAESVGWTLASMAFLMALLFFILAKLAQGAPSPLNGIFQTVGARVSGQAYQF